MVMTIDKIGEQLVKEKLITEEQLKKAIEEQKKSGGRIGVNLTKLGFISAEELTDFLSRQYGIPSIDLGSTDISPEAIKTIPANVAKKYQIMPIRKKGATLVVATADPSNIFAINDIKFLTGSKVECVVAPESAIISAIDKYYEEPFSEEQLGILNRGGIEKVVDAQEIEKEVIDAPVIKIVNKIFIDAINECASDIHLEPYEDTFRVRFRRDGILHQAIKTPVRLKDAIISRVKIMANLDIAERRLPQDGRIKLKMMKNKEIDCRVSVIPTLFGEKVVLRLLDKSSLQRDMTKLGFDEKGLKDFLEAIYRPWGMVLVTGPTGSGKTTTLYSALAELNKITENISTVEDPVEYNLMGINQVQIHEEIGLNFATVLRALLRQDPDIIMVGEVRDYETAEVAIKAALTGHLVLSTLHTNDAPSTINRLLDMGIKQYLLASSINLILAQRLVRKICNGCKSAVDLPAQVLEDVGFSKGEASAIQCYKGRGCEICNGTGYSGRIALYEVMPITESLKELVMDEASTVKLRRAAIRDGMKTLRMSGLDKVKEGLTTVDEVLRVTMV